MTKEDVAQAKGRAAQAAADEVADGMLVGLGTGSTAALAIAALGERVAAGLRITTVATSLETERLALKAGLKVLPFEDIAEIDLGIDGADEIDPELRAIKGGGGAMLREKIVAQAAARMICIVDQSKLVARLGARPVPVEVLPYARTFVADAVQSLGGEPVLRLNRDRPAITDQGNILLDCHFGAIDNPERLAAQLQAIPGLLAHGMFLSEIDVLLVGESTGVSRRARD